MEVREAVKVVTELMPRQVELERMENSGDPDFQRRLSLHAYSLYKLLKAMKVIYW